jgi:hypothetical protein
VNWIAMDYCLETVGGILALLFMVAFVFWWFENRGGL